MVDGAGLLRAGSLIGWLVLTACGSGSRAGHRVECLDGTPAVARVGGCDIGQPSLRYAVALSPGVGAPARAMHALIERELLAQGALAAGDAPVTVSDVQRRIAAGEALLLGARPPTVPWVEDDGGFDYRRLEAWVGGLGMTRDEFVAEQRREVLAQRMRERLGGPAAEPGAVEAWLAKRCAEALDRGQLHVEPDVADHLQPCAPPPPSLDPGALNLHP